jgi:sulfate adenylyltransferase subunit 2
MADFDVRLESLVNKSIYVIRETKSRFKNPAVMWSGGKDSTLMLELCKQAFFNTVPFTVIHIDTGKKFPEIYAFRDKLAKEWNLDLRVAKAEDLGISPGEHSEDEVTACCMQLKVEPWKKIVKELGFDALIMSIRRDEHEMRNYERYFSPRSANDWKWHLVRERKAGEVGGDAPVVSEQEPELWDLYATEFQNCDHVRVHPLLHWTELDVWQYTSLLDIPISSLYMQGYRSLGCQCCTVKGWDMPPKNIEEIISRIEQSPGKERAGRAQDKEKAQTMRRLRMMGYM